MLDFNLKIDFLCLFNYKRLFIAMSTCDHHECNLIIPYSISITQEAEIHAILCGTEKYKVFLISGSFANTDQQINHHTIKRIKNYYENTQQLINVEMRVLIEQNESSGRDCDALHHYLKTHPE